MQKSKKRVVLAISISTAVLLLAVLLSMFLYMPSNISEGLSKDIRFKISYFEYENYFYQHEGVLLPFRLKTPKKEKENETYPLVVYLHGGGSQGTDNRKQMHADFIKNIAKYGEDCYVFMPQVSEAGRSWDEGVRGAVYACLDEYLLKEYAVDEDRLYAAGSSMGACNVYDLMMESDRFAAALIEAGTPGEVDPDMYAQWKDKPLWIGHGRLDEAFAFDVTAAFVAGVEAAGGQSIVFEIFDNKGHHISKEFYGNSEVWQWLFDQ